MPFHVGNFGQRIESGETRTESTDSKCPKCGFSNPSTLKFCGNCGARLAEPKGVPRLQTLSLLLISTSLYLVISILTTPVLQAFPLFLIAYLVSALLGAFVGYGILVGERGRLFRASAVGAISVGLVSSFILFVASINAPVPIGPVWIFFVIIAWVFWRARKEI